MKEKRFNQGYEIIEGCTIGSKEIVIGYHRTERVILQFDNAILQ